MSNTKLRQAISLGLLLSISAPLVAQDAPGNEEQDRIHGPGHEHDALEEVIVTATPLPREIVELSQSATVLRGDALNRELANNIGDTLSRLPGLSNASFGQNVGRPVIRGQQGSRVGMLANNMTSADIAGLSQDHAVPVEPFLADQIEVLRGPTTLLYGSGAIGGVVNVVTHSIPEAVPQDGVAGKALAQVDTAADQRMAAGRIDLGSGSFAFHADGFSRRSDDYEIPGMAELYPEDEHDTEHDEEHGEEGSHGVLENSFLDNEGGSIGASYIGDTWRFGMSFTGYSSDYGIPGAHAHEHGEEDHGEGEEHDEGEEHGEEEEELVSIGLDSDRIDAELVGTEPFAGFEQFKLRLANTDYQHIEFEGDEVGTRFDQDTFDARLELRHKPIGSVRGAFGAQYTDRDFSALGEEAFVPPSETETMAVFLVESLDLGSWQLDFGLRYEDVDVRSLGGLGHEHDHEDEHGEDEHLDEADGPMQRDFQPFTLSFGAVWHVTDASHLTFNLSRAERAPADAELFANGPHLATQTFEVGDPDLGVETNLHFEAGYRIHAGQLTGSLVVFADRFDDFIYEADLGEIEDGLPVRLWTQQDADFDGIELELRYDIGRYDSGHWQVFGFGDRVKGELSDGRNVPRLPPSRIGVGMDWDKGPWAANMTWIHASAQNDLADFETRTPGYDLLNAEASWLLPFGEQSEWAVYLRGHNLLDEDIRNSTSFLKDQAPQIGRNFTLGVRGAF